MIFWYSGPPEVKSSHFALLVCPKLQYLSFATDLELLSELKFEKKSWFLGIPNKKSKYFENCSDLFSWSFLGLIGVI